MELTFTNGDEMINEWVEINRVFDGKRVSL